jgi:hypothetical protein
MRRQYAAQLKERALEFGNGSQSSKPLQTMHEANWAYGKLALWTRPNRSLFDLEHVSLNLNACGFSADLKLLKRWGLVPSMIGMTAAA